MCGDDDQECGSEVPGSVADALRMGDAFARYLNSPAAAGLDGAACGEVLIALGGIQAKLAAAYAGFLRRFDAADAHNADGYGSSSAWLAAKAQLTRRDARAAVRQMRQFGQRKHLAEALAAGGITGSWAAAIADWTKKLPADMRDETDRILLEAAAAGASLDDLATIAACAIEKWRQQQPDPDQPGRRLRRPLRPGRHHVRRRRGHPRQPHPASARRRSARSWRRWARRPARKTTAPRASGSTTPCSWPASCCCARSWCRTGPAPTPRSSRTSRCPSCAQLPGAGDLEDAWIRAFIGEDGYLTGKDAEAAACDAPTVPVVTGTMDPAVIDQMIDLARTAAEAGAPAPRPPARARPPTAPALTALSRRRSRPGPRPGRARSQGLSPEAWRALRYAMARLAIDLVSGPAGVAAILRQGLLDQPYNTPSLPLDIGYCRLHPLAHPPRRPAPGPQVRLAEMRPPRRLLRRAPPAPQGRRRRDLTRQLRPGLPVPP